MVGRRLPRRRHRAARLTPFHADWLFPSSSPSEVSRVDSSGLAIPERHSASTLNLAGMTPRLLVTATNEQVDRLFALAAKVVEDKALKLGTERLLVLYGLFKQGNLGDCPPTQSSGWSLSAETEVKRHAWGRRAGLAQRDAKVLYAANVLGFASAVTGIEAPPPSFWSSPLPLKGCWPVDSKAAVPSLSALYSFAVGCGLVSVPGSPSEARARQEERKALPSSEEETGADGFKAVSTPTGAVSGSAPTGERRSRPLEALEAALRERDEGRALEVLGGIPSSALNSPVSAS
jgi:acyl-CoA-binding protein